MKHNKILSKAAFAALLVAANMPVDGQVEAAGIQETYLASSGCSSCGGGGRRSEIADNSASSDMYNARMNSYQTNPNSYSATGNAAPSMQGNAGNANSNIRRTAPAGNASAGAWRTTGNAAASGNAMNANRTANGSWSSSSTSGQPAYDVDVEVQRSGPKYTEEYSRTTTTMGNETITEEELLVKLNPQGRADYMSMDPKGKAMALQLASQTSYQDKNMAVKEAKKRSSQQGMSNRY
jgi:hypothetical protein